MRVSKRARHCGGAFVCTLKEDKPRPLAVGEEKATLSTEDLPLGFPLPLLVLTSRKARAPKLRRRANGLAGTLVAGASPSSKGLSSTDAELALEMLSVRERSEPKGVV